MAEASEITAELDVRDEAKFQHEPPAGAFTSRYPVGLGRQGAARYGMQEARLKPSSGAERRSIIVAEPGAQRCGYGLRGHSVGW